MTSEVGANQFSFMESLVYTHLSLLPLLSTCGDIFKHLAMFFIVVVFFCWSRELLKKHKNGQFILFFLDVIVFCFLFLFPIIEVNFTQCSVGLTRTVYCFVMN